MIWNLEDQSLNSRFWDKVALSDEASCWEWLAFKYRGYGRIAVGTKRAWAHRVAWSLANGELRSDLVIDHICRNHGCVNPAHLRAVPQRDNVHAPGSLTPAALNARKTHCKRGHELSPDNLYHDKKGRRVCKPCHRAYQASHK